MLKIDKTDARLGINSYSAKQYIQQPKADFELNQKHVKLEIHTEQIKVKIDQQQCFNETGLKSSKALIEEAAELGRQAAAQGIDRIVSEGNMMAAIESGSDAIAEIALNKLLETGDYNIDVSPKSKPTVDFVGGTVDIKIDEGYVQLNTKANKPIIDVELGRVEFYLTQKPYISVQYVGNKVDAKA